MYVRRTTRRNKDGSSVTYLQLAENVWDPERGQARARVIHSLGREEDVDREALVRLVQSIGRFLEPGGGTEGGSTRGGRQRRDPPPLWSELQVPAALAGARGEAPVVAAVEPAVREMVEAVLGGPDVARRGTPTAAQLRLRAAAIDLAADAGPTIQAALFRSAAARLGPQPDRALVITAPVALPVAPDGPNAPGWDSAAELIRGRLALAATGYGLPAGVWISPDESSGAVAGIRGELAARGISGVVWEEMSGLRADEVEMIRQAGDPTLLEREAVDSELPSDTWEFRPLSGAVERLEGTSAEPGRLVGRDVDRAERERRRRDARLSRLRAELQIVGAMPAAARGRAEATLVADTAVGHWLTRRRGVLVVDERLVAAAARRDGLFALEWPAEDLTTAEAVELRAGARRLQGRWAALDHIVPEGPAYRSVADRLRAYGTVAFLALVVAG